jgi:hypothetical protein
LEPADKLVIILDNNAIGEDFMRSCLLYLIGVPIPIIILLWVFTGHM